MSSAARKRQRRTTETTVDGSPAKEEIVTNITKVTDVNGVNPSQTIVSDSFTGEGEKDKHGDTDNDRNDDDENNDYDCELPEQEQQPRRQRGKRRRGRVDTSKQTGTVQARDGRVTIPTPNLISTENHGGPNITSCTEVSESENLGEKSIPQQQQQQQQQQEQQQQRIPRDKRYCLGRKPVTDYVIGQTYPGTVVYAKPFGIFIDIGCHSDAFCHVSRVRDEYVEAADQLFHPGDVIPAARVLEIDRTKKRITVSLQSLAMRETELLSIQYRRDRLSKRNGTNKTAKSRSTSKTTRDGKEVNSGDRCATRTTESSHQDDNGFVSSVHGQTVKDRTLSLSTTTSKTRATVTETPSTTSCSVQNLISLENASSSLTPAEQKRARKLARRAERRAREVDTAVTPSTTPAVEQ